jgi:SpoVK/Ycf46/Vps4 family AAA+-type ATPase
MRTLSRVHARWGTGRVWDEAGISALFAGAPGTGKTMAAEVLAARLGLPMFRVDLSQVVNKYIGETEKNLRRLFDSMEESDSLLFFDEAESLFGQRIQARNANDRFANMEISYLLQRMERFRGVAILATNRRKDLDEAFLRRLRFVMEFPLPDAPERKRIWQTGIPPEVDASGLDFDFLARQYALSGGHIRSIVLHACLQSAGRSSERKLSMETVMLSVKREYQKLDRTLTREQCGRWSDVLEEAR